MDTGVLKRYGSLLPITSTTPLVTLGEGSTPLVKSTQIGPALGCHELYFKLEGCNPTGSFKDRGMVVAIAKTLEAGSHTIMCASTGNTSASAAAYGAHCNLDVIVLVPQGDVAPGKLAQAIAYGARILVITGTFDQALTLVRGLADKHPFTLVNSLNPYRIEGQKTAAFEISDILGDAPDDLFIPVGNAGNITAYWKGFVEYHSLGMTQKKPRMMGFQAEGAAPIVKGSPIPHPTTIASAIRIGNPASWKGALSAQHESQGVIDIVSDEEIIHAYKLLARKEGIFCEPASAASLAGLLKLRHQGADFGGRQVVCVITGTGLKSPDIAAEFSEEPLLTVEPSTAAIESALASLLQRGI